MPSLTLGRRIATTIAAVACLVPLGAPPAFATSCYGGGACHVENTINGGYYEQGIEAQFQSYTGYVASSRVMSIALNRTGSGGDQVEFGWRQHSDYPGPEWFVFAKITGTSRTTSLNLRGGPVSPTSGYHTYRIEYDPVGTEFDLYLDGSPVYSVDVPSGAWTSALPVTNVERHDLDDDFSPTTLVFKGMRYRSASTWHLWTELGSKCFIDTDDAWSSRWDQTNNRVLVDWAGPTTCANGT
jgi:hypothetical protein